MNSKKRSAEESLLNEGFCEDFSTPTKKQRIGDQSLELRPSDIACLKEGRECHSILPKVEEMWDQPLENLKKIENPCEIDESESDKNEMVIFDE